MYSKQTSLEKISENTRKTESSYKLSKMGSEKVGISLSMLIGDK